MTLVSMFPRRLPNLIRCPQNSCFFIVSRQKSEKLKPKNPQIGERIKQLNQENKNLFGQLLETRAKRRKSLSQSINKVSENVEEISPSKSNETELLWQGKKAKKIVYRSKDITPNKTTEVRKLYEISAKQDDQSNHENIILPRVERIVYSSHKPNTNKDIDTTPVTLKKETEKVSPNKTSSQLKLPTVVIRNMTRFAMLHKEKNVLKESHPVQDILTIVEEKTRGPRQRTELTYPSVSKILNATMSDGSRAALKRWREKMISELGEEGFLKFYRGKCLSNRS